MIMGIISLISLIVGGMLSVYAENSPYDRSSTGGIGNVLLIIGFIGTAFFVYTNFNVITSWFKI